MSSAFQRFPGHPDALCDLVAASLADAYVRRDPATRISLSVHGGHGALFISGDVLSQADVDVSTLVQRTLATYGVFQDVEPFVHVEKPSGDVARWMQGGFEPAVVYGYATQETSEQLPSACVVARQMAQALDQSRRDDDGWVWLGGDGSVFVTQEFGAVPRVVIRLEHGSHAIADVRRDVRKRLTAFAVEHMEINLLGPCDQRGLVHGVGRSGSALHPYGTSLPSASSAAGRDPQHPFAVGSWLARSAARWLLEEGARAAMVRLQYLPGEDVPFLFSARDEAGRTLSSKFRGSWFSRSAAVAAWSRPQLLEEVMRWGFTAPEMPWEEVGSFAKIIQQS